MTNAIRRTVNEFSRTYEGDNFEVRVFFGSRAKEINTLFKLAPYKWVCVALTREGAATVLRKARKTS